MELPVAQQAQVMYQHEYSVPIPEKVVHRTPRLHAEMADHPNMPVFEYFEGGKVAPGMYVRDYDVMENPALRKLVGSEVEEFIPHAAPNPDSPTVPTPKPVAETMIEAASTPETPCKQEKRSKTPRTERLSFSGYVRRAKLVGALSIVAVSLVGGYKSGGGPSLYSDGDLLSVPKNLVADVQQVITKPFPTVGAQLTRIHK